MRTFPKTILGLALMAGLSMPAFASADIVEDFSGTTIPTTLVNTFVAGGGGGGTAPPPGGAIFDGASAIVGGVGDTGRAYIGTVQSDFGLLDFTAEIDITVGANNETNSSTSFFGLGAGEGGGPGGGGGFDEPTAGADQNSIFVGTRGTVNFLLFDEGDVDITGGTRSVNSAVGGAGAGTHRLRLEHDVTAGTLTYSIDIGSTGTFVVPSAEFVFDTSNNGFDATNSQIFFGGSDGRVFDNFTVTVAAVPEPTSLSVLGLLGLGLFSRRRRS